jgi:hypothetical protein
VQEGKLARTSFPPWWDDVRDAFFLGVLAFPHGRTNTMLFDMRLRLYLCKSFRLLFEMFLCL